MQPKEAIRRAREIVADMFADENPVNLGLEEIEYDDRGAVWKIAVGFSRSVERNPIGFRSDLMAVALGSRRIYKTAANRDADGAFVSIKNRDVAYP